MIVKQCLLFSVRLAIAAVLLIILGKSIDLSKAIQLTRNANLYYVLCGLLLILGLRILLALRWEHILNHQGIRESTTELLRIIFVSSTLGQVLPGGVGADLMRGYQLNKQHGQPIDITATIIIDRFIGIYSMFLVAMIGAILAESIGISTGLGVILILANAAFVVVWYLGDLIKSKLDHLECGEKNRVKTLQLLLLTISNRKHLQSIVLKLLLLSLLVQLTRCLLFWFLYSAYDCRLNIIYFLIFIPIMFVIAFIPISVGGLGIRESTLAYFFGMIDIVPEISVSVGILFHLLQIVAFIPGAVLWLFGNRTNKRKRIKRAIINS